MVLPMFLLLTIAVFIAQLVFCLFAKQLRIKLLPVCLAAAGDILCWVLYISRAFSLVYGGDFAAFIYGMVLLMVTAVAGLAWGIYGIVNVVQKQRK